MANDNQMQNGNTAAPIIDTSQIQQQMQGATMPIDNTGQTGQAAPADAPQPVQVGNQTMQQGGGTPTLQEQNGQGTSLIDDVTGSGEGQGSDMSQTPPDNSSDPMVSARNAFSQAFANTQQNTNAQATPQATAPIQQQAQQGINTATPTMQQTQQGQPNQNTNSMGQTGMQTQYPAPDVNQIRSMINSAVDTAVNNGQLEDLTANDIAQNSNYGEGTNTENAMSGVNGEAPLSPDGTEVDIISEGNPSIDIESDEFFNKFSENPGEAIMDIASSIAQEEIGNLTQQIQPLIDESNKMQFRNKVQSAIQQFSDNGHEDFPTYRTKMVEYLNGSDLPMDDSRSYELAYNSAKVDSLQQMNDELSKTHGRTLADYMSDDDSIGEMSKNETVRQKVISDYLNGLSNGESPQVITDSAGNSPVGHDPNKAKSIKEASKMFLKQMR